MDEPVMNMALTACSSQSPATAARAGALLSTALDSQWAASRLDEPSLRVDADPHSRVQTAAAASVPSSTRRSSDVVRRALTVTTKSVYLLPAERLKT
jgi:hypothetical protein